MTMSIDGFVTDTHSNASGLHPDLGSLRDSSQLTEIIAHTCAVLMGRKTFAMSDPDDQVGGYEFRVPIFVLTHRPSHHGRTST